MKYTEVKRSVLYKEVWTTPMLQLAKKYGMSDRGLAKLCSRHDVPRPSRGYWAKLSNGITVRKKKLPNPTKNTNIRIHKTDTRKKTNATTKGETEEGGRVTYGFHTNEAIDIYEELIKFEEDRPSKQEPKIKELHPYVLEVKRKTERENKNNTNRWGRARFGGITVYKEHLPRAYQILNIMIRDFEHFGFKIKKNCTDWQEITYGKKTYSFTIEGSYSDQFKVRYKEFYGIQDGPRHKLDKRLGSFILAPFYSIAANVDGELMAIVHEQKRQEEKKQQEMDYSKIKPDVDTLSNNLKGLRESLASEKEFLESFNSQFDEWQKSLKVRQFIEAKKIASGSNDIDNWLDKANALANFYDPFTDVVLKRTDRLSKDIKNLSKEIYHIKKPFNHLDLEMPEGHYSWWW